LSRELGSRPAGLDPAFETAKAVCPVTLYQPIDEVNGARVDFLKASAQQVRGGTIDRRGESAGGRRALRARGHQRRGSGLGQASYRAKAVRGDGAQAPDIPELLVEMRKCQNRIRDLEAELGGANRLPETVSLT
jgi:hypothetical protein